MDFEINSKIEFSFLALFTSGAQLNCVSVIVYNFGRVNKQLKCLEKCLVKKILPLFPCEEVKGVLNVLQNDQCKEFPMNPKAEGRANKVNQKVDTLPDQIFSWQHSKSDQDHHVSNKMVKLKSKYY